MNKITNFNNWLLASCDGNYIVYNNIIHNTQFTLEYNENQIELDDLIRVIKYFKEDILYKNYKNYCKIFKMDRHLFYRYNYTTAFIINYRKGELQGIPLLTETDITSKTTYKAVIENMKRNCCDIIKFILEEYEIYMNTINKLLKDINQTKYYKINYNPTLYNAISLNNVVVIKGTLSISDKAYKDGRDMLDISRNNLQLESRVNNYCNIIIYKEEAWQRRKYIVMYSYV